MGRTSRQAEDLLGLIARRLGASLAAGRVLLSHLETCLADAGADPAARSRALAALHDAGIEVVRDCPDGDILVPSGVVDSPSGSSPHVSTSPPVDPTRAARVLLEKDREVSPRRRARRILTAEEEVGLTLIARPQGTPLPPGGFANLEGEPREAAEAMLLHNLGLAHAMAHRMGASGLEYEDLVDSAIPGLVRAVELFDPLRGLKFSTYAMAWVRQSIGRAVDDEARVIRLPVYVCEAVRKVRAAQERLTVEGKTPRHELLAEECDMPVEKVIELLRLAPAVVSLETPLGNDGLTVADLVDSAAERAEHIEVQGLFPEDIEELLMGVSAREADVLQRRFGLSPYDESQTLEDIGVVYGVTRERIRQVEAKAMDKIREALRERGVPAPEPQTRKSNPGGSVKATVDELLASA